MIRYNVYSENRSVVQWNVVAIESGLRGFLDLENDNEKVNYG